MTSVLEGRFECVDWHNILHQEIQRFGHKRHYSEGSNDLVGTASESSDQRGLTQARCLSMSCLFELNETDIKRSTSETTSITEDQGGRQERGVDGKLFQPLACIGAGSFAKVFLGSNKRGNLVAAKVMNKSFLRERKQSEGFHQEVTVLGRAQGPFIVKFLEKFETSEHSFILTEYCCGGEFLTYLDNYAPMELSMARFYAAEICYALAHLHKRRIFFGDLKPENIVLTSKGHLRLIDFGLSIDALSSEKCSFNSISKRWEFHTSSGSLDYAAPEILRRTAIGFEADWWALGICTFEMVTGNTPFFDPEDSSDPQELCNRICRQRIDLSGLDEELGDENCGLESFLSGLLKKQPSRRLGRNGSKEVLDHPFFSNLSWADLASEKHVPPVVPLISHAADLGFFSQDFFVAKLGTSIFSEPFNSLMLKIDGVFTRYA